MNSNEKSASPSLRLEKLLEHRSIPDLTKTETCALYHLTGYVVNKVVRYSNICEECKKAVQHNDDNPEGEYSILLKLKEFKPGVLCRLSQEVFDVVRKIEELFRTRTSATFMELPNAMDLLEREASTLDSRLPSCHDVQKKITTIHQTEAKNCSKVKSSQVTFIYIALVTIQIVTKQLHNIKSTSGLKEKKFCQMMGIWDVKARQKKHR